MSRSRLFARSVVLAVVFLGPAIAVSCGGSSTDKPSTPAAGASSGGSSAGAAAKPDPIACGADTCKPLSLPFDPKYVAPCCTAQGACGLDSTPLAKFGFVFDEVCQATNQPGDLDATCPPSPQLMIPLADAGTLTASGFPGCCRAGTHTCGYLMNKIASFYTLEPPLGCVDSAPFLDGGTASACGSSGGASGAGN
jgi:hypothetical protein